jgi:5-methylcytosine-specific restriction endonuclease McrA
MIAINWKWFVQTANTKINCYVIKNKGNNITYTDDITKATNWGSKENAEKWIKKQDKFWASFCVVEENINKSKLNTCRKSKAWKMLKTSYGDKCIYCGLKLYLNTFTIEHVIPQSKGGSDYLENLRPCCEFCNSTHKNPLEDRKQSNPDKILKCKWKFQQKEEKRQSSKWIAFCIPHA